MANEEMFTIQKPGEKPKFRIRDTKGHDIKWPTYQTAYDDTPLSDINLSANMLHETSGAYKNPQQLQEQDKTVLHNIISKLPSYEQTGGNTGGLVNALIRKFMTRSYDRKKSPYILDEMPQESIPPKSK